MWILLQLNLMLLRIVLLLNMADNKHVKYSSLIHQINAHNNDLIESMSLSTVLISNVVWLFLNSSLLPFCGSFVILDSRSLLSFLFQDRNNVSCWGGKTNSTKIINDTSCVS